MSDMEDALRRLDRGGRILFRRDSPCLTELSGMLASSDRRTVVLRALACSGRIAAELGSRHPDDGRPEAAVSICGSWARGRAGMSEARRAILDVHAMARGLPATDAALCHAVGQGCSCVHTPRHALGLPVYELSAMVMEGSREAEVGARISDYLEVLDACAEADKTSMEWARFLR